MTKFFTTTGASLVIALTLAGPANAQLLGGGVGGGLGGGIGLGGGLPIGSIGAAGDFGVSGAVDGTTRSVRSTTRVTQSVNAAVRAPAVAVPRVRAPALAVPAVPAVRSLPSVSAVRSVVAVPAIPDLALRRSAIIEAGIPSISYAEVPGYVDHQYVVLQDELRGTGVTVEKRGQQIVLEMPSDVTFSFDKYNIQPRFYGVLDAVSHTLARYSASYVDVNGHTDAIGSFGYNQVLSERRADSVADYLAVRRVNPARLHVQGFGRPSRSPATPRSPAAPPIAGSKSS